jgi:hypothetical protein
VIAAGAGGAVEAPVGFAVVAVAGLESAGFVAADVAADLAIVVVGATGADGVGVLSLSISMLIRLLIA